MAFIDLTVLEAIRRQGVEELYCTILEDIYEDGTATIKLHTETDKIPKLFTVYLEEILKKLEWTGIGIKIGDEYLNNLRFADDIVLFSESTNEMQQLVNDLNRESLKVGLKMNNKKTKIMFSSRVQFEQIHVQEEVLEEVDKYIYLG